MAKGLEAALARAPANQEVMIDHHARITSYNVCYTKLLRFDFDDSVKRRAAIGGTAPEAVLKQIEWAKSLVLVAQ